MDSFLGIACIPMVSNVFLKKKNSESFYVVVFAGAFGC